MFTRGFFQKNSIKNPFKGFYHFIPNTKIRFKLGAPSQNPGWKAGKFLNDCLDWFSPIRPAFSHQIIPQNNPRKSASEADIREGASFLISFFQVYQKNFSFVYVKFFQVKSENWGWAFEGVRDSYRGGFFLM